MIARTRKSNPKTSMRPDLNRAGLSSKFRLSSIGLLILTSSLWAQPHNGGIFENSNTARWKRELSDKVDVTATRRAQRKLTGFRGFMILRRAVRDTAYSRA